MEIRFERSGGFAGRATNISGVVHFVDGSAVVSSDASGYRRVIEAAEAEHLQKLAGAALSTTVKSATGGADQFQYTLSIHTDDGRERAVPIDPHAESTADGAVASSLDSWVLREMNRVWADKINKVKK